MLLFNIFSFRLIYFCVFVVRRVFGWELILICKKVKIRIGWIWTASCIFFSSWKNKPLHLQNECTQLNLGYRKFLVRYVYITWTWSLFFTLNRWNITKNLLFKFHFLTSTKKFNSSVDKCNNNWIIDPYFHLNGCFFLLHFENKKSFIVVVRFVICIFSQ